MTLRETIQEQFHRPHGILGRLAGRIMANRGSNVERNLATVELLAPEPGDRVLEVGHGPGIAVAALAERVGDGHVVGLDHSQLMNAQAARRNRDAVADGHVELVVGDLSALHEAEPFDRIMMVNVAMFWDDPVAELKGLRSLLVPGGPLAVTHQPRNAGASAADTDRAEKLFESQLEAAGFVDVLVDTIDLAGVSGVCLRAHAPAETPAARSHSAS